MDVVLNLVGSKEPDYDGTSAPKKSHSKVAFSGSR